MIQYVTLARRLRICKNYPAFIPFFRQFAPNLPHECLFIFIVLYVGVSCRERQFRSGKEET